MRGTKWRGAKGENWDNYNSIINKIYYKRIKKYMAGCIVSLIFLYASKDTDPIVCIIKETKKAAGFQRRITAWGWVLE